MPIPKKEYLGDGVYVRFQQGTFVLTAENGICARETIFLEPRELEALIQYRDRVQAALEVGS